MSSQAHKAIIIVAVALLNLLSTFVIAIDPVSLCSRTELPALCNDCLHNRQLAGVDAPNTTVVANALLTCSQLDANQVHSNMTKIIEIGRGRAKGDLLLLATLGTCSTDLVSFIQDIKNMQPLISQGKCHDAIPKLDPLDQNLDQCNQVAKNVKVNLPQPILKGIDDTKTMYKNSLQLLKAICVVN